MTEQEYIDLCVLVECRNALKTLDSTRAHTEEGEEICRLIALLQDKMQERVTAAAEG